MDPLRKAFGWTAAALILFLVIVWATKPLRAHDWYSSTTDPVSQSKCCGGNDCAPVDPAWVSETEYGYLLQMTVEQARTVNPKAVAPVYALIPWARVQAPPTADHLFYACIWERNRKPEDGSGVICFFATPTM
ncbi:hypothetical protein [Taklimakanibacter deserti]|uniref:hypothetical protein n=1 Tax=Taklimakanibacter deserti TaxID=2267839 RepID=UPI000E64E183